MLAAFGRRWGWVGHFAIGSCGFVVVALGVGSAGLLLLGGLLPFDALVRA